MLLTFVCDSACRAWKSNQFMFCEICFCFPENWNLNWNATAKKIQNIKLRKGWHLHFSYGFRGWKKRGGRKKPQNFYSSKMSASIITFCDYIIQKASQKLTAVVKERTNQCWIWIDRTACLFKFLSYLIQTMMKHKKLEYEKIRINFSTATKFHAKKLSSLIHPCQQFIKSRQKKVFKKSKNLFMAKI